MTTPQLHVFAACSAVKALPAVANLHYRQVAHLGVAERAAEWSKRLREGTAPSRIAEELYGGPYWADVRELVRVARNRGYVPSLWVLSAGYGLIPSDLLIKPYSATFSPGHPDSIAVSGAPTGQAEGEWWKHLSREVVTPEESRKFPRNLLEVLIANPESFMLVMGSANYLQVLRDDLGEVLGRMGVDRRLVIVTGADYRPLAELTSSVFVAKARLVSVVGGALPSLHARVATKLLERVGLSRDVSAEWRKGLEKMLSESVETPRPNRKTLTDQEVRRFIHDTLVGEPSASATGLLRRLRSSGQACEQSRFRGLFLEVREMSSVG